MNKLKWFLLAYTLLLNKHRNQLHGTSFIMSYFLPVIWMVSFECSTYFANDNTMNALKKFLLSN